MKYLIIILLFSSCMTTYKAYQKVAADPFVDERESVLLSQKCLTVYPDIRDTGKIVSEGVDSASYNATIEAYNDILDSIIAQYERTDELALFDTTTEVHRSPVKDSLKIIRNFLRKYRPPPIVKTIVKEVAVKNTAWEAQKNAEIQACRAEKEALRQDYEKVNNKLAKRSQRTGWFIGGGLLLIILSYIGGRITRR